DLSAPTAEQLREMAAFVEEQSKRGIVYVHCKAGYSRSAAAVAAYLLESGRCENAEEAIGCLREARPAIVVRPEIVRALTQYGHAGEESSRQQSGLIALIRGASSLIPRRRRPFRQPAST